MRSVADEKLIEERRTFRLLHCCEDCVHFDGSVAECAHAYPTADHRRARYERLVPGDEIVFCKEWELR